MGRKRRRAAGGDGQGADRAVDAAGWRLPGAALPGNEPQGGSGAGLAAFTSQAKAGAPRLSQKEKPKSLPFHRWKDGLSEGRQHRHHANEQQHPASLA